MTNDLELVRKLCDPAKTLEEAEEELGEEARETNMPPLRHTRQWPYPRPGTRATCFDEPGRN